MDSEMREEIWINQLRIYPPISPPAYKGRYRGCCPRQLPQADCKFFPRVLVGAFLYQHPTLGI